VNQSRKWLPDEIGGVTWLGEDRPATSVLFPLYAGGFGIHPSVQKADVLRFDKGSMWTTFNFVANYAMLKYSYMIKDIRTEQQRFESRAFGLQQGVEAKALTLREKGDVRGARRVLTQYSEKKRVRTPVGVVEAPGIALHQIQRRLPEHEGGHRAGDLLPGGVAQGRRLRERPDVVFQTRANEIDTQHRTS
jgi:hypothetical protein